MSGVTAAGFANSLGRTATIHAAPKAPVPDSQALPGAKQALAKAQARVDADRSAHSPNCVAFDQKGVEAASAAVAQAVNKAQTQASTLTQAQGSGALGSGAVSIVV